MISIFLTNNYFIFYFFIFDKYIYKHMTRNKKNTKQQPTEIEMADNTMAITGIKMKYLSLKENEYGHNHFLMFLILPLYNLLLNNGNL